MAAKSPTASLKLRELIGEEQFSQRREVFGKHDTVFLPASPTLLTPTMEVEPVFTSDNGKTTSNFQRSTAYSSMRESRRNDIQHENAFRGRKYSDNFTSELNQRDDVDYRHSMTERTRRISKLRRDFLASNLHDPASPDPFSRSGTRASLPVRNGSITYKIESPKIHKFPFAEPYATPPPVRKVIVDLGPVENGVENAADKENEDPEVRARHESANNNENETQVDHHKLFDELVKRYSPQRKPIDWTLPPTKPRVVSSVVKGTSDSIDSGDGKYLLENNDNSENPIKSISEVFIENEKANANEDDMLKNREETNEDTTINTKDDVHVIIDDAPKRDSKVSLIELDEKNDRVVELSVIQRQLSSNSAKRGPIDTKPDLTIPDLLEKMSQDATNNENPKSDKKKVKRKRSFLDKLLGRKKEK